jgi:hypothetical protein
MKTIVLLAIGAAVLYRAAKHYNINSLSDLKGLMPVKAKES